jgi:NADH-quinone oxidoreductase subunit G
MNRALYERLGLGEGDRVLLRQGGGEALVPAGIDDRLPANCIRLAAGRPETASLGDASGELAAERVPAPQKAAV